MKDLSPYKDIRREFFHEYFNKAHSYADFVQTGSESQQKNWNNYYEKISLTAEQNKTISQFTREMNILIMAGIWCGDCARQMPIIKKIAEANNRINLRIIDNKTNPELQDELRINGAEKVPVVVVLSEDFFEVSRFGDKHLCMYRDKAKNELGAACDAGILPPDNSLLEAEVNAWVEHIERAQLVLRLAPMLRRRHND